MATKAYRRFIQRVDYYGADLELCALLVDRHLRQPNTNSTVAEALGSTNANHPYLGRRINSRQSRQICGGHLKNTLFGAFVKDVFEDFSEFLSESMTRAAQKGINPGRFVGQVKIDLHAADILATGGWDQAVKLISDSIFRKLENERNTRDLIQKASDRLGLVLPVDVIDSAMPYLDARHILVHRDGKTDEKYRLDYPHIRLKDGKIVLDAAFAAETKEKVIALASAIDGQIIAHDLVRPQDMAP